MSDFVKGYLTGTAVMTTWAAVVLWYTVMVWIPSK